MNQSKRGFGSMDEQKQREIASKGGKASHGDTGRDDAAQTKNAGASNRGGSHEQHVRAGEQSHKNR